MTDGPKILTIDIETSPNLAHVWGLWNQNVGLSQLMESGEVISFAAKWRHEDEVMFASVYHDGKTRMVRKAFDLLSDSDYVVHFNGVKFDIPHLNREFLIAGYAPAAPFAQVDLLKVVKKNFRFPSNKLDYVAQALGLGGKTSHTGHQLWVDCLNENPEAWELMKTYNMQDVVLTEKLYDRLLPWISGQPHAGLFYRDEEGEDSCPNCGSLDLRPQGRAYTSVSVFQRFRCAECGKWSRGSKRLAGAGIQSTKI